VHVIGFIIKIYIFVFIRVCFTRINFVLIVIHRIMVNNNNNNNNNNNSLSVMTKQYFACYSNEKKINIE